MHKSQINKQDTVIQEYRLKDKFVFEFSYVIELEQKNNIYKSEIERLN